MSLDLAAELARYGPASSAAPPTREAARAYCLHLTRTHYENFTVGSWLLPRTLRQHMAHVYAYCRWADDLADEPWEAPSAPGDANQLDANQLDANQLDASQLDASQLESHQADAAPASRLELLDWWRRQLEQCPQGPNRHPVYVALAETLAEFSLPLEPFRDLLSAFRRDQTQTRYDTWTELADYARQSANPVGRIVLGLWRCADPKNVALSDDICTGLQYANFCQDVARDARAGRIYLPRETWTRHGCTEADFLAGRATDGLRRALAEAVERAAAALDAGASLATRVPRRLAIDVELFVAGGRAILQAIRRQGYDVWTRRPTVGRWRKCRLGFRAVLRAAWRGACETLA